MCGSINWFWAQAHQQSWLWFSQSSTSMRLARAKPGGGFMFNVQKWFVKESGIAFLVEKPNLDTKSDSHWGDSIPPSNLTSHAMAFRVTCWMFIILLLSSLCGYHYWCYDQSFGPFIFRIHGFPYLFVASGLILCPRCILCCKNSRLLCSSWLSW